MVSYHIKQQKLKKMAYLMKLFKNICVCRTFIIHKNNYIEGETMADEFEVGFHIFKGIELGGLEYE